MTEAFTVENGVLIRFEGDAHSIVIPENVRVIGDGVFKGMAWITDVTLPEGLTEIGSNAFKGCRQLAAINFPAGLKRIGDFAFHRCHALTAVLLPDSVETLGTGVFLYCDRLRELRANGVRRLEKQAVANDTQLTALSLHSEIDCSNFGDDIFTGCIRIQDIRLSDGFCYHAENLFSDYIAGKTVHPVVRKIAESLFQSLETENGELCRMHVNLREFELPEGITCIGKGCFFDKRGFVSLTFPARQVPWALAPLRPVSTRARDLQVTWALRLLPFRTSASSPLTLRIISSQSAARSPVRRAASSPLPTA